MLLSSDLEKQKMKLGPHYQILYPSEGSSALSLGNDFGWLHYIWIDIGTPRVSFLVALDAGSDLLWVPCDCIQCAPLSSSYYSSLDKNLNEYNPSKSTSSKYLHCNHELCESGSKCNSPKQPCPYTINYETEDTSTSGLLVEDTLHLASGNAGSSNNSVQAPVIIGCGSKQSGGYLDGVAPDGLMGLGLGKVSVPSNLAKAGYVPDSFSLCFDDDDSGKLFFGDQGMANQQHTPFLPLEGNYVTYIIGVEASCVRDSCLMQTGFRTLVDSGSSFTYLPSLIYQRVVDEFDRQVNATKTSFEGYPFQCCYKSDSSTQLSKVPPLIFKFSMNNTFEVQDPTFVIYGSQGPVGFCLALQSTDGDIGTIGQNFMTGYRMVFDREKLKLGWSRSDCQDLSNGNSMPINPPDGGSANPLPATEQQNAPQGHGVPPAVAKKTPSKSSSTPVIELARGTYEVSLELLASVWPAMSYRAKLGKPFTEQKS
ncbi:aspartic protease [Lithospermum erythrorhizon]|uniref:Aspartic protease n=1 Tax=Lithospermum erythrorhizon TaxID=34254 RepID=A0AAV3Q065_LITER